MRITSKNLGRMELSELVNHLSEIKSTLKNPGVIALRLCECCINVDMPAPNEEILTKVDIIDPTESKREITMSIK